MNPDATPAPVPVPVLVARSAIGGILMGLANLVPGISGGTMLLASGIYPRFIQGMAEVTTLRFRLPSLVVLGVVVVADVFAIGALAGLVKDLVVGHRWVMYSLFIGLTLGGLPVVWKMVRTRTAGLWGGAAAGFLVMAVIGYAQMMGWGESSLGGGGPVVLFAAGVVGAAAMILPGISGGYMLLVMGQYVPILAGIEAFVHALKAADVNAAMGPFTGVILPVGIGVVIGVVGVANGVRWLLNRFETPTLGVLLGLLVGAVVGLWPFQAAVQPQVGDLFKGTALTAQTLADLRPEKWPSEFFTPSVGQVATAIGLITLGFAMTAVVAWIGKDRATA